MRYIIYIVSVIIFGISSAWSQQQIGPDKLIYPSRMAKSKPLRDIVKPIHSTHFGAHKSSNYVQEGAVLLNFAGLSVHENPTHVEPGDPNLDVGPNHLIQMVNMVFAVGDKSGVMLVGPATINSIWSGFGGACEFNNDGDPIVLYDPLADRWLMSQMVFSQKECIAISQTSDPTGAYFLYEFDTPGNDNPKLSVWSDGYYAGMKNLTTGQYDVYVFERDKMLVGDPNARAVVFSLETLLPGADNFLPADIDGVNPPPAGAPGIFLGIEDPSVPQSHLVMFELSVDWNNVVNSTLTGPTNLPVSLFDANLCNFSPDCIRQPNTNQRVDALSSSLMHRVAYRNFGTHEAMVTCHTVDVGDFTDHAGIRWYEFRNNGNGWSLYQEGTYAPDTDHRWNGSIAMNGNGDIMMGYTVSSVVTTPTIRFVGRQANDPLGQMTLIEGTMIESLGSQVGSNRWGDYSATVVDPSDDFTFWHTNYWVEDFNADWHTWIGKFQPTTSPPNLTIQLTPQNPPIVIPAGGGTFTYDITVTNVGPVAITFDIWNMFVLPDGSTFGPTIGPLRRTFLPGQVFTKTGIVQNIPAGAPPGNYTFSFQAGRFSTNPLSANIIAIDSFPFTKSTMPTTKMGGDSPVNDWATNWEKALITKVNQPEFFILEQNYPNPFNPSTIIRYTLNQDSHVTLTIYNTLGQKIIKLVDEFQKAGFKSIKWDGKDASGHAVAAGLYLYKLEGNSKSAIKKMVLIR